MTVVLIAPLAVCAQTDQQTVVDRAYCGRPVTTREFLFGRGVSAPHAADLRRGLAALG